MLPVKTRGGLGPPCQMQCVPLGPLPLRYCYMYMLRRLSRPSLSYALLLTAAAVCVYCVLINKAYSISDHEHISTRFLPYLTISVSATCSALASDSDVRPPLRRSQHTPAPCPPQRRFRHGAQSHPAPAGHAADAGAQLSAPSPFSSRRHSSPEPRAASSALVGQQLQTHRKVVRWGVSGGDVVTGVWCVVCAACWHSSVPAAAACQQRFALYPGPRTPALSVVCSRV